MAQTFNLCCSEPQSHLRNAATGHVAEALMICRRGPVATDICLLSRALGNRRSASQRSPHGISVTIFGAGGAEFVSFFKKAIIT